MICLNQILASSTSKSSHSLSLQRFRKLNEGLLRQNGDHNIIYIQTASPPGKKKPWQCNILRHKWWTEDYDPECPPGLLDARAFSRGWRAFTTMLMFGRKSASYCTHNAATAANYLKDARKQISISIQWQVWVDKKLMKKIKQHATALISHLNIALCTI